MNYKHPKYPNRLRVIRQNTGYTQRQIAYLLGHPDANKVCSWENEHTMPNATNLIKLCIIYGMTPRELYPEYYQQVAENVLDHSTLS